LEEGVKAAKERLKNLGYLTEGLAKIEGYDALYNEAIKAALTGEIDVPAFKVKEELCKVYELFDLDALRRWSLREGARETLEALHSKAKIGLFTTVGLRGVRGFLEKFNVKPFFDVVVTREDVSFMKPYPDGLRMILWCFDVPKEKVIFIGDSRRDILAAKEVGIRFAYIRGGEDREIGAKPDYYLNSIREVLSI
jgi:phosphoglycolate phosphatase